VNRDGSAPLAHTVAGGVRPRPDGGRIEVLIVLAGLTTIAAFLMSTEATARRLRAVKAETQANHVLQVKMSVSNLRLEQALSGQAQILGGAPGRFADQPQGARQPGAVDVEQEIYGNLADAAALCRARLDGGASPVGRLSRAPGTAVRANLASLCEQLAALQRLTEARLSAPAGVGDGGDVVRRYEQHFREALRLADEDSRALDDVGARDEASRRRTTEVTTVALALLFLGLAAVVRRHRRVITGKNVELGQLASIVDCTDDAIFSLSLDRRVLSWNRGAEHLYGHTRAEAVGLGVDQLMAEPSRAEAREVWRDVVQGRTFDGYETTGVRRDGSTVDVSLTVSPLRDVSGLVGGVAVIGRDVSARKQAERAQAEARDAALAASRLKSEFLANMSHEIRTPINGVIGLLALLLDTSLDRWQRRYAEGARQAADDLLGIINDILDFSKIEAGKIELEKVDLNLQVIVEGVADLLALPAHGKGLELACQYDPDLPTDVRGDPVRLRQVLVNLVTNAVKFTEEGEVIVRAQAVEQDPDSVLARFEVRDTGVGLAPSDHERLFDAFSQADASTTRRFGGTGLGLAVSKQLVELMGGEIGVESELGRGSTFWFSVRLERQPGDAGPAPVAPDLGGLRVLVVDDNATQRLILEEILTRWGTRPVLAEGGHQALELLELSDQPFQLAILDHQMPGMDGLQLAHRLRLAESAHDLPLILLASTGHLSSATAAEAGISVALTKPARQSDLYDAILEALSPSASGPGERPPPAPAAPRVGQAGGTPIRVLVVEDNYLNQTVALGTLEALGYQADVAANGLDALQALERERYALVLMDCQMPEMDGYEVTAEIRRREAGVRHMPIIAMTANAMAGDREACLAAGMDDYISKPIDRKRLEDLLARWASAAPDASDGVPEAAREPGAAPAADPSAAKPSPAAEDRHDAGSVLDPSAHDRILETFGSDGPGFLGNLISIFLEDAPTLLAALRAGLHAGDAGGVRRAAHTLKSNGANLGALAFASLCERAETAAAQGVVTTVTALVPDIEAEYVRVEQVLQAVRRTLVRP